MDLGRPLSSTAWGALSEGCEKPRRGRCCQRQHRSFRSPFLTAPGTCTHAALPRASTALCGTRTGQATQENRPLPRVLLVTASCEGELPLLCFSDSFPELDSQWHCLPLGAGWRGAREPAEATALLARGTEAWWASSAGPRALASVAWAAGSGCRCRLAPVPGWGRQGSAAGPPSSRPAAA